MINTKYICLACALVGLLPGLSSAAQRQSMSGERTVVVLPARKQTVKLGFDMLALRPRLLFITYQGTADSDDAGMHVWNGREWLRLSDRDYAEGNFLTPGAVFQQMYLVGPEDNVPPVLQYRPVWSDAMQWIQSLQVKDLVNVFGERFNFTRREWRWIAEQHDLRLFESGVRLRREELKENRPKRSPEEARRPFLERLRLRREGPPAPETPGTPPEAEHEPWREIPVRRSPTDRSRGVSMEPMTPPIDERVAPDIQGEQEVEIIEEQPAEEVPAVLDPVPSPVFPYPEPEPEPEPAIEEKGVRLPAEIEPPAEERDQAKDANTNDRAGLTPEEVEFFELIRREFPDLDKVRK